MKEGPDDVSTTSRSDQRPRIAVVLAAGQGTRMRSETPKVLHAVAGRPMLHWVIEAAHCAGCEEVLVVVAPGADAVRSSVADADGSTPPWLGWVVQEEQRGTGHALLAARDAVTSRYPEATVLVLSGDTPLLTAATLERLVATAEAGWGALAVAELDEPGNLGRVLTRPDGTLSRIVEASDASPGELSIGRVNAGIYAFPAPEVFAELADLTPDNAQRELYLTDVPGAVAARGEPVLLLALDDASEAFGVNTRSELARAHRGLLDRHIARLMEEGVTILAPEQTVIEPTVTVGPDTVIHPGVSLLGACRLGTGCTLHQGAWLRDTQLADDVVVEPYSVLDRTHVATGCRVGPFARLRPGAELAEGARVGNFVEVKNARLGEGVRAGHLSYLGDTEIGAGSNIGAGVVTCNYDGHAKHRTEIGENAFVGSDTMLVAPVRVGDEAVTGAGSVITHDVPEGALGVGRSRQRTIPDWARRRRAKGAGGDSDTDRGKD